MIAREAKLVTQDELFEIEEKIIEIITNNECTINNVKQIFNNIIQFMEDNGTLK